MNKVAVRWVGPIFDSSGYAAATRNYVCSLIDSDEVDLTVSAVSFEPKKTTHGTLTEKIAPFMDRKDIPYKVQVTHLTPENYPTIKAPKGIYNVAYTVWETERLPDKWVPLCNIMDEIWVPSAWNKKVFEDSGVKPPVHVVPHAIEPPDTKNMKCVSMGVDDDVFVFYSIFQWIERKNPIGLLRAYLTEFGPDEKVCLALKTYRIDASAQQRDLIKRDIGKIKEGLRLDNYPTMRLFGTLLPHEYMRGFHDRGDCFVLAHRGEGFGIPFAEAMSYGKPVIGTGYSGNTEFMNKANSYLIDYQRTPVSNMIFPLYNAKQVWAEPDLMHLRELMRTVFENREAAKKKGKKGQADIKKHFSHKAIADVITKRIRQIYGEIS